MRHFSHLSAGTRARGCHRSTYHIIYKNRSYSLFYDRLRDIYFKGSSSVVNFIMYFWYLANSIEHILIRYHLDYMILD